MTTFQIASDLHIEYRNDNVPDPLTLITPSADILILAGDIGSFYKFKQLKEFLTKLCFRFKIVMYVPGNHEYYNIHGYKYKKIDDLFQDFLLIEQSIDNLYVLNRSSVRINDVCIVGCTLWSKPLVEIPKFMIKFHGMNNIKYEQKYNRDLEYIQKMIKYCSKKNLKLLVVTHYCPTYSIVTERRKTDRYISLYTSHLDHLLNKTMVHTWVCGHIHINFDLVTDKGTHLVGNQKGKPKDKLIDYKKDKIIIV